MIDTDQDGSQVRFAELRARRDLWVDTRLLDVFMHNTYAGLPLHVVMILATALLLWWDYDRTYVLGWTMLALSSIVGRYLSYARYLRTHATLGENDRLQHFKRSIGWLWGGSGLLWVLIFWLCYGKVSLSLQTAFLLVMVSFTALAADRFAAWPSVLYWYISSAFGGVILVMLARLVQGSWKNTPLIEGFVMIVLGLCWVVLLMRGERLHQVQQSTLRLQHRNQQLTRSLTRKTEAALRASALKNRLLAAASHDIRQPIHALSLYAQYLEDDPQQASELAPRILQASRAINNLFDSLLSYAQMESGGLALRVCPVQVDELLRELAAVYEAVARDKGLELRVRLPSRPVVMLSDPVQLRRIVGNLLDNAIKYTHQGDVLLALQVLPAQSGMARARVTVADMGQGIPEQYQNDIFGEFITVPSFGRSPATGGVGLGLAIVSRLAHALGHIICMRSRVDHGSIFRLTLDDQFTAHLQGKLRVAAEIQSE